MSELKSKIEIPEDIYEIIIIGGGPAGLTAGLYSSRSRIKTLLVESLSVMGQATMTDLIENYPGIEKINGFEFVMNLKKQAQSFGLECRGANIETITRETESGVDVWKITDGTKEYKALSLIVASGAYARRIGVPGEEELISKGVSYCATCDGAFFKDKEIVVVGGGNTAVEEALFLTKFGRRVSVVHRRDRLRASGIVQERAFQNDKINFIWDSVVEEIKGDSKVEGIKLKNVKTDEVSDFECDGVFIFIGWKPNTGFLTGEVKLDEKGFIVVDSDMNTTADGVFGAGDCCNRTLKQIVTACGDGAVAAFSAEQFVQELKGIAYK